MSAAPKKITEGQFVGRSDIDPARRRQEWVRYYGPKRIRQTLMQVHFLASRNIESVLEIGPYYGLTTAMLDNAGFEVSTADLEEEPSFWRPNRPHVQMDLTDPNIDALSGYDAIVCCETLEHIHFDQAIRTMKAFREAGPRYLLISVPYKGWQIFGELFINRHIFHNKLWWWKFASLKKFKQHDDPHGHKWEIGYKGYPLKRMEKDMIEATGWKVIKRDFSYPTCCVFYFLEPR